MSIGIFAAENPILKKIKLWKYRWSLDNKKESYSWCSSRRNCFLYRRIPSSMLSTYSIPKSKSLQYLPWSEKPLGSSTCHLAKLRILNFLFSFAVAGFDMMRSRSWGLPVRVQKMNETRNSLSISIYHPSVFPTLLICFFSLPNEPDKSSLPNTFCFRIMRRRPEIRQSLFRDRLLEVLTENRTDAAALCV